MLSPFLERPRYIQNEVAVDSHVSLQRFCSLNMFFQSAETQPGCEYDFTTVYLQQRFDEQCGELKRKSGSSLESVSSVGVDVVIYAASFFPPIFT